MVQSFSLEPVFLNMHVYSYLCGFPPTVQRRTGCGKAVNSALPQGVKVIIFIGQVNTAGIKSGNFCL